MSRLAGIFAWINTRLGWWSLIIVGVLALATFSTYMESGDWSISACGGWNDYQDEQRCREDAYYAAVFEVLSIALLLLTISFAIVPVQLLRNHFTLRRDRAVFTPRWESIKDQYSRGGYQSLDDMEVVTKLRDGLEPRTQWWLAGRTAWTVGVWVAIWFGLTSIGLGFLTAEDVCQSSDDLQVCNEQFSKVYGIATGIVSTAAVAAIALAVAAFFVFANGRHARQAVLDEVESLERDALERLRTKP